MNQPQIPLLLPLNQPLRAGPHRLQSLHVKGHDDGRRAQELEDQIEEGVGSIPVHKVVLIDVAAQLVPLQQRHMGVSSR